MTVLLAGCQFLREPETIPCVDHGHCPPDYFCDGSSDGVEGLCSFGDPPAPPTPDPDGDGDGHVEDDCDDDDPNIHPGAEDPVGDDIDANCDGIDGVDADGDGFAFCEGWPLGCPDDADCDDSDPNINPSEGDVYGDEIDRDCDGVDGVDGDDDGHPAGPDCDDSDPTVHPDAVDVCGDAEDTDCGGESELDGDLDGHRECDDPPDCDDGDDSRYPGAEELCDAIDSDCDGFSDLEDPDLDLDGDGATVCFGADCDDADPLRFAANPEVCDGVDNDCDDAVPADELDDDADGFRACEDCSDTDYADDDADRNPDGTEVCNGLDDDCDGSADFPDEDIDADGDGALSCEDCDDNDATRYPGAPELCDGLDGDCDEAVPAGELDGDGDGALGCADCDDGDAAVWPGATEVCDGVDSDCDGVLPADEQDGDGDGVSACEGDCDDAASARFPGNVEVCDAIDNDCDGVVPADEQDGDGDGHAECAGDCEPANPAVYPGATEACDGLDTDCDGGVPANEEDGDGDGLSECAGDCDDGDSGSTTTIEDADCDGVVDCGLTASAEGMDFAQICAGAFEMGCTAGQSNCGVDESPVHTVTLTNDFWLAEREVTQGQWLALIGNNPSSFGGCGLDCPVEQVNWFEALAFANEVSLAQDLDACFELDGCTSTPGNDLECTSVVVTSASGSVYDCVGFRLPTEAEWEYAARAGTDQRYSGSDVIDEVAWYSSQGGSSTHPGAGWAANDWGLYDLSGNVWEICWDLYESGSYSGGAVTDPEGAASGTDGVERGGGWGHPAALARVANRNPLARGALGYDIGFRLARTLAPDADDDGFVAADDCDDGDPTSTVVATDGDCDGLLTADDCDDSDPALTVDSDGDGLCDEEDVCPAVADSSLTDTDGDGVGDACDACPNDPTCFEDCTDGLDNDGDAEVDCDDIDCAGHIECASALACDVDGHTVTCDDQDPCSDAACVAGECVFTPYSGGCDDGDPATADDVCIDGVCLGDLVAPPVCTGPEVTSIWPTSGPPGTLLTLRGCGFGTSSYATGRARARVGVGQGAGWVTGHQDEAVTTLVMPWAATGQVEILSCPSSCTVLTTTSQVFTLEARTDDAFNAGSTANGASVSYDSFYSGTVPWDGGNFLNSSNGSTWTKSTFDGVWLIDELWVGIARDDASFLQAGCADFELQRPDLSWVTIATTCAQPPMLEPGWRLTIDPPMDAIAARFNETGHGWFILGDLRAMGERQ
jgi:formylglycine-generating enzyme required for sulfatase activity